MQIGRCHRVPCNNYSQFRKVFYPNLILFFGPNKDQNAAASQSFANVIQYSHTVIPASANEFILYLDKTENYVVDGIFCDISQIKILEEYFEIKIVHFKYNRIDCPDQGEYFDKEYELVNYLKDKCFYVPVCGKDSPVDIMDRVGEGICPRLLFAKGQNVDDRKYIDAYI